MVKIKIISVGKIKQQYFEDAINDYIRRLSSIYKVEHICVNTAQYPDKINQALANQAKDVEGENILKRVSPTDYVICLNLKQKTMDSIEFSDYMRNIVNQGNSTIVFVVGGSYGLGKNILKRANQELTLSAMTLIHEMAIVFLLEQLYRGINIQKNTPYHK